MSSYKVYQCMTLVGSCSSFVGHNGAVGNIIACETEYYALEMLIMIIILAGYPGFFFSLQAGLLI